MNKEKFIEDLSETFEIVGAIKRNKKIDIDSAKFAYNKLLEFKLKINSVKNSEKYKFDVVKIITDLEDILIEYIKKEGHK